MPVCSRQPRLLDPVRRYGVLGDVTVQTARSKKKKLRRTFDMSNGCKQAKLDGRRPLDGGVRAHSASEGVVGLVVP